MDFEVPEKIKVVTGMIDEFVDKEIIPLEPEYLRKAFKEMLPVIEEKRAMVKKMELWAPNHPKEYGGMELNLVEHAFVSESLGRSPLGHFVFGCQAPDAGNIEILHRHGTPEQKETYLRPLVQGKIRSCFSMTEVEMPGSNPVMLDSTAVKDGEDGRDQPGRRALPTGKHDHRAHGYSRVQPGAEHSGHGAFGRRLRLSR